MSRSAPVIIGVFIVLFALLLVTAVLIDNDDSAGSVDSIPACQEDEVVVGNGDFSSGYWSNYECVPADLINP